MDSLKKDLVEFNLEFTEDRGYHTCVLRLPMVRPEFRATAKKKKDAEKKIIHDACMKLDRMGLLHGNPATTRGAARSRSMSAGSQRGASVGAVGDPLKPKAQSSGGFDGSFRAVQSSATAALPPAPPATSGAAAAAATKAAQPVAEDPAAAAAKAEALKAAASAREAERERQRKLQPKGSPANRALNKELRRMAEQGNIAAALERFAAEWAALASGGKVAAAKTKDHPELSTVG